MPPRGHSSSSHSSRSHSSRSRNSRSRSSGSRSHSSGSHSSGSNRFRSYNSGHSNTPRIKKIQIDRHMPKEVKDNAFLVNGRKHNYIYYDRDWTNPETSKVFHKGYYDEEGTFYNAEEIAFKNPNGTYKAHFKCEYCGSEADYEWSEGQYPTCNSCGAVMSKTTTYYDELVTESNTPNFSLKKIAIGFFVFIIAVNCIRFLFAGLYLQLRLLNKGISSLSTSAEESTPDTDYPAEEKPVSNLDIYGSELYLKCIDENTYEICTSADDYDKHILWDYGVESYYDYNADCYIWYNTDVSPNLWQYWYDDIAGEDSEYGWMECEGDDWYIETASGWEKYDGDTSGLWHIKNSFDEQAE